MNKKNKIWRSAVGSAVLGGLLCVASCAHAEDWPMWGRTPDRNMVSPEKDPPTSWDTDKGTHIKWTADLGSKSYGNPIISAGLVYVGTNNEGHRDPSFMDDAGVLMAFRESDGKFMWQEHYGKLKSGRVNDWPGEGLCSTVYSEGNLIWYCTNRCEVVCMDVSASNPEPKVVWKLDMIGQLGVFPHNMTACSITSWNNYIYVITGNGVDETHIHVPAPSAPAIVCLDKRTGQTIWTNNSPGAHVLHGQWSSPAISTDSLGRTQVIAPLGDGWIYSFDPATGKIIWKFDSNNKDTVYPNTRNELIATPVVVGDLVYIANGQDPEHSEGPGHLWCIKITGSGDVSKEIPNPAYVAPKPGEELIAPAGAPRVSKGIPNPNTAVAWDFEKQDMKHDGKITGEESMHRTISSVVIDQKLGLVYSPDFSGYFHCLDAKTGQLLWNEDTGSAIWGSPLLVDGKVYIGNEAGDVLIFQSGREKNLLATNSMGGDSPVYCSPIFANGTLYIMTRVKLFAISNSANPN